MAIAEGKHLFPFRTEQLSPPAPMVLLGSPSGRVGRCRITNAKGGAEKSRPVRVFSIHRGMVFPWKSQKVIVETINPLAIETINPLAINVEMKDALLNRAEMKETLPNLILFEKIGEA